MMKFIVYKSTTGWRWRLVSGNRKVMASGEGYATKANAKRACKRMQTNIFFADIEIHS